MEYPRGGGGIETGYFFTWNMFSIKLYEIKDFKNFLCNNKSILKHAWPECAIIFHIRSRFLSVTLNCRTSYNVWWSEQISVVSIKRNHWYIYNKNHHDYSPWMFFWQINLLLQQSKKARRLPLQEVWLWTNQKNVWSLLFRNYKTDHWYAWSCYKFASVL